MTDTLKIKIRGWQPQHVAELLELVAVTRSRIASGADGPSDDGSWRDAVSTGWTLAHVKLLRGHLADRHKTVQLQAFDLAIKNGGSVSREQVFTIGAYAPERKLNNWTAPINNFADVLVEKHGLPEDAEWPIETDYEPGSGFKPARGFLVAPEIVKLVREAKQ